MSLCMIITSEYAMGRQTQGDTRNDSEQEGEPRYHGKQSQVRSTSVQRTDPQCPLGIFDDVLGEGYPIERGAHNCFPSCKEQIKGNERREQPDSTKVCRPGLDLEEGIVVTNSEKCAEKIQSREDGKEGAPPCEHSTDGEDIMYIDVDDNTIGCQVVDARPFSIEVD